MKRYVIFFLLVTFFSCQSQNKDDGNTKKKLGSNQSDQKVLNNLNQNSNIQCEEVVCLQLINHDPSNKSFDIYMLNSMPVAGFQSDFPGINIVSSDGGLLKENGYQTSHNSNRLLSFSMQAKLISAGEGLLTSIIYSDSVEEICMTAIIFAGMGGEQLSSNEPECIK